MVKSLIVFAPTIWSGVGIAVLALVFCLYVAIKFRSRKTIVTLAAKQHRDLLITKYSRGREWLKTILVLLALSSLSFALLRPKWGKLPQVITQEGRNIIFMLDMSRSMLAQDLSPSRLDFVKLKLRVLIEKLGPERVGLVLFADRAFIHCPFTNDFNAFFSFLDQANSSVVGSSGTSIAKALDCAVRAFNHVSGIGSNKIVFLITDGEDFSPDIEKAVVAANNAGLAVFTIGAATTIGAPVPIVDQQGHCVGHEKNAKGEAVISRLNESFLQDLAHKLHGDYVRCTGSEQDIDFILQKINSFEKEKLADRRANLYIERHNIFTAIFFVLMCLEWLI